MNPFSNLLTWFLEWFLVIVYLIIIATIFAGLCLAHLLMRVWGWGQ